MAGILQHLRSSTLDKRPNPGSMVDGQVAINYASGSPGLFFKDSAGALVKVGPVHVGTTAPNVSPASGGTAGNSRGEQWLDTSGGSYVMKIWDGSAWRTEAGEFVNATGDIMTGALGMPPASAGSPTIYFSGDTDTGIYSPGANQLAISTAGAGRLFVDASGNVGIGTQGPGSALQVNGAGGIRINEDGAGTKLVQLRSDYAGQGPAINVFTNDPLLFLTNNSERLRITSDGKVGIGTSSPSTVYRTTINGDGSSIVGGLSLRNNGTEVLTIGTVTAADAANCEIWNNANGYLRFATNATERARIDSSGRLLVGTSSYDGNARAVFAGNTSDNATGAIDIRRNTARPTAADTQIGALRFISNDSTSSNYTYASIDVFTDGASSSNTDIPGRLVFSTTAGNGASSPTERMRVDSLGRTQLFSAGGNHVLRVASDQAAGTAIILIRGLYSATDNSTSGTESFRVFTNGNVVNSNNSYGAISDIKLKENIVDASSQWNDLKALQVRKYNFKEGQTHTQIGLVAQEVELVSPGLVNESPDRDEDGNDLGTVTKSVNYSVLYMKAVKALQEAMERIETLEQRLNNAGIN